MKTIILILSIALLSSCGQREFIAYEESELQPWYWPGDTLTHGELKCKVKQARYWQDEDDSIHKGIRYRLKIRGTFWKAIPEIFQEDLLIHM